LPASPQARIWLEIFSPNRISPAFSLKDFPERFPSPSYNFHHRMMPVGNYLIFYEIAGDDVVILHIRHAPRIPFSK
jgi:plasmid stabilization system protein ParE